ncbi:MAG TPA: hypothetical protein VME69_14575 [Methylocella sp.]|nr:hypothetical protein [Methylocella sp.]
MTMTFRETLSHESAAKGGFVDAIGGLATIVLGVLGLAGVAPNWMIGIATVVFGSALLIQGGTMLSEYAHIIFPPGVKVSSIDNFGGNSLSVVFLVGAAGIVLGILALLGVHVMELTPIAIIAFGTALVLSSNAVWQLHVLKHPIIISAATGTPPSESQTTPTQATGGESRLIGSEILAHEMASGSAGLQALAGLAAIVLGVLALAGTGIDSAVLILVAFLALGATMVLTGSSLSGTVLSLMRPTTETAY